MIYSLNYQSKPFQFNNTEIQIDYNSLQKYNSLNFILQKGLNFLLHERNRRRRAMTEGFGHLDTSILTHNSFLAVLCHIHIQGST